MTALVDPFYLQDWALLIRCIHQRGDDQARCLVELDRRGLWLSPDQRAQAGLQESIGAPEPPNYPSADIESP